MAFKSKCMKCSGNELDDMHAGCNICGSGLQCGPGVRSGSREGVMSLPDLADGLRKIVSLNSKCPECFTTVHGKGRAPAGEYSWVKNRVYS